MRYRFTAILFTLIFVITAGYGQIPRSAYIVNTLGESLTRINLENQSVINNAATLGLFPNQGVVYGQKCYVVNSGVNEIQVIDLVSLNTVQTIDMGAGTNPWALDFVNQNLLAVSLLFTNQVAFVNVNSGQIMQTVTAGLGPEGLVYFEGKIFVANSGFNGAGYDPGTVSVIDVATYQVETIPVSINPQSVAVSSQGQILVACSGDFASVNGRMDIIDPSAGAVVQSVPAGAPVTLVVAGPAERVYLSTFGSGVLVYNLASQVFEQDAANPLPGGPGLAVDSQENLYIADFASDSVRVYAADLSLGESYLVGDGPVSIALFEPGANSISLAGDGLPKGFTLFPNFPNPFNPRTVIPFQLSRVGEVTMKIYDVNGKPVRTLVNGILSPGSHTVEWNGRTDSGLPAASGIYFYVLQYENQRLWAKMHLIQ